MPFVKLDCGILASTIWYDYPACRIFLTALLMAEPREYPETIAQMAVRSLEDTGWEAQPGWYGYVPSSGIGIIRRAGDVAEEDGFSALERLGNPEAGSRSQDHEGRRLIRIDGGYLVLNYDKYRERDYGAAERMRRLRERRKRGDDVQRNTVTVPPNVTQADTEADTEDRNISPPSSESKSTSKTLLSRPPASTTPKRVFSVEEPEMQLAVLLLDRIRARNPQQKEPDLQKWAKEIDCMHRLDGRNGRVFEDIRRVILWCQADEFWQNNILSPAKLRKQFDQLLLKSGPSRPSGHGIASVPMPDVE
jgi:hypothetical protein